MLSLNIVPSSAPSLSLLGRGGEPQRAGVGSGEPPALTAALAYHAAGFSVIAIKADGTKAPDMPQWKTFQQTPPTESQLRQWFSSGAPRGLGAATAT